MKPPPTHWIGGRRIHDVVWSALETISPIVATHREPPGRYFKLADGGTFLLVDVCVLQTDTYMEYLDVERHGKMRPLFDKEEWLRREAPDPSVQAARRASRLQELEEWFSLSQSFVHKALHRGQETDALAAFWGYTLRPLVVLLRMRYCSVRWDFGMRYLERDLPDSVYLELRELMFVSEPALLADHHAKAVAWGERLLRECVPFDKSS